MLSEIAKMTPMTHIACAWLPGVHAKHTCTHTLSHIRQEGVGKATESTCCYCAEMQSGYCRFYVALNRTDCFHIRTELGDKVNVKLVVIADGRN